MHFSLPFRCGVCSSSSCYYAGYVNNKLRIFHTNSRSLACTRESSTVVGHLQNTFAWANPISYGDLVLLSCHHDHLHFWGHEDPARELSGLLACGLKQQCPNDLSVCEMTKDSRSRALLAEQTEEGQDQKRNDDILHNIRWPPIAFSSLASWESKLNHITGTFRFCPPDTRSKIDGRCMQKRFGTREGHNNYKNLSVWLLLLLVGPKGERAETGKLLWESPEVAQPFTAVSQPPCHNIAYIAN